MSPAQVAATRERRARHSSKGVDAGDRPIHGVQQRSAPPVDTLWIGTFNLRWWQHIEHNQNPPEPENAGRRIKSRPSLRAEVRRR
jgi:hypothetical protein